MMTTADPARPLARLVDCTLESTIAYCCRVSNPKGQNNHEFENLLRSCIKRKEWSVLESSCATIEINTELDVAAQILRHRSFTFQQFSQRWATEPLDRPEVFEVRRKGEGRYTSIYDEDLQVLFDEQISDHIHESYALYERMLGQGVHPEVARRVLPLCAPTRLYVTGNLRSWYHYILARYTPETQAEHRDVALACFKELSQKFPVVCRIMEEAMLGKG